MHRGSSFQSSSFILHRRALRLVLLASVTVGFIWLISLSPTNEWNESFVHSRSQGSHPLERRSEEGRATNPFEEFRRGWPKLRNHEARGKPIMPRGDGETVFDWIRVTKLFVL
jgi:hypothetical protein